MIDAWLVKPSSILTREDPVSIRRILNALGLVSLLGVSLLAMPGDGGASLPAASPVVMTLKLSGVRDIAANAKGVYVLRSVPYPGDASGAGWEVDLLSTKTWQVLQSASGDAAPQGLVLGFSSVWVLTGYGAKPGGLGAGVNRLGASTLANLARISIGTHTGISVSISDTSVWLLGPTELDRIDPTTNAIAATKSFPNLYAEGIVGMGHDVLVGSLRYPGFEHSGPVPVSLSEYSETNLKLVSHRVIARYPSGAGDPPAIDLATTSSHEIYIGLSSNALGQSLAVESHGRVFGPNKRAGGTVSVSDTGVAWAAKYVPPVAAKMTLVQQIGQRGEVERNVASLPGAVEAMAGLGSLLVVATPSQVEVLR
jgi:hypothetical protein